MNRIVPFPVAQPGMTLGEAATAGGQVLLAAGTVLTTAHIAMLRERKVRTLVLAEPEGKSAAPDAKSILATDKALRPRFARTDLKHPAMKEMYRLALLRHTRCGTFTRPGPNAGGGNV